MSKLLKHNPDWLNEAKEQLVKQFGAIHTCFLDATKRAAWLGLFLNYIKERGKQDGSIPHGQFRPWLDANVPDISYQTVAVYMAIGRNVAEKAKLEYQKYGKSDICHRGELPESVIKLCEGKTQYQLLPEYKQTEIKNDTLVVKRGRRPGEGGASKEQRAAAKGAEAALDKAAKEMAIRDFGKWVGKNCVDTASGVGLVVSDAALQSLNDWCKVGYDYTSRILTSRGK